MSSTSSTSLDFNLRESISRAQIGRTISSELEYQMHSRGMNGFKMESIRKKNSNFDTSAEATNKIFNKALRAFDKDPTQTIKMIVGPSADALKNTYYKLANDIHLLCEDFWSVFHTQFSAATVEFSAVNIGKVNAAAKPLIAKLQVIAKVFADRQDLFDLQAAFESGTHIADHNSIENQATDALRIQTALIGCLKMHFGFFDGDDSVKPLALMPLQWRLNVLEEVTQRMRGMTLLFMNTVKRQLDTITQTIERLNEWSIAKQEIAKQPVTCAPAAIRPAVPTVTESYESAQKLQKAKVKKCAPAEPDPLPVITPVEKQPPAESPKVEISDKKAFATYQRLLGKGNLGVTWDEAVYCLKTLGFEVIQPEKGGNTWKFKWKNKAWLRDEKTWEELSTEFDPSQAGTSSRAFHLPHHNGLSQRTPLDEGRLKSFKKLLNESLFEKNSVTLLHKS